MSELTPTEELILEVLAARWRLGENLWTFDSRLRPRIEQLAVKGYVQTMGGVVQNTCRAALTEKGLREATTEDYVPPIDKGRKKPRARTR